MAGVRAVRKQHYQMLAYLELRDALVRRYMILHDYPRRKPRTYWASGIPPNPYWGTSLVWLLTLDFKRAMTIPRSISETGKRMVKEFPIYIPEIADEGGGV